jgi:hypothetical protein
MTTIQTIRTSAAPPSPAAGTSPLLRLVLKLDAAVTGANGVAYLLAAGPLADWLGVPDELLRSAGAFLVAYAAAVYLLATRPRMPRAAVLAVIVVNAGWALDSGLLLAVDGFSPSLAGQIAIAVQALGVAAFAALQYAGLRRAR